MGSNQAFSQKRYAIVIGNSSYKKIQSLPNASSDAKLFAKTLKGIGFQVEALIDLPFKKLEQRLFDAIDSTKNLPPGSSLVFFYAGHGVQNDIGNLLLPIDYRPNRNANYLLLQEVLQDFSYSPDVQKVFIIDACREIDNVAGNPLVHSDSYVMPDNSYLAFSTNSKGLAQDGVGKHSPYMESLSKEVIRKGLDINTVFQNVRNSVQHATNFKQSPTQTSSLNSTFYFLPGRPNSNSPPRSIDHAKKHWVRIKNSQIPTDFTDYMNRYPNGKYFLQAEKKLLALRKKERPKSQQREIAVDLVLQGSPNQGNEEIKVVYVAPNSLLRDKLMEGDIILEINGNGIDSFRAKPTEFLENAYKQDQRLDIWLKRDGSLSSVSYY